jgi:hypothetical protein
LYRPGMQRTGHSSQLEAGSQSYRDRVSPKEWPSGYPREKNRQPYGSRWEPGPVLEPMRLPLSFGSESLTPAAQPTRLARGMISSPSCKRGIRPIGQSPSPRRRRALWDSSCGLRAPPCR